jgi:hypothetical protein
MLSSGVITLAMCPAHIARDRERLFKEVVDGYISLLGDFMDEE